MSIEEILETSVNGIPEVRLTEDSLSLIWGDNEVTVSGADGRRIAQAIAYVLLEAAMRR